MSWIRSARGHVLFCNRDERRERGPELAPQVLEFDGTRVLAPRDGDHGGTWIAVNEHGLTLCVLNGYAEASDVPRRTREQSRGLLALELASADGIDALQRRFERAELDRYRAFELLALEPGREAALLGWNGSDIALDLAADRRVPLVSSGFDERVVRERRTALFGEMTPRELTPTRLEAFHGSHAGGPSAYSVCMHRGDAETKSSCRVVVDAAEVRLRHTPGPPCRTQPSAELALPRRARASAANGIDG